MKRTVLLGGAFALLLGALTVVSHLTRPPSLPPDEAHRGLTTNASCGPCHGAGARSPLKPRHPPKDDCRHCHRAASR